MSSGLPAGSTMRYTFTLFSCSVKHHRKRQRDATVAKNIRRGNPNRHGANETSQGNSRSRSSSTHPPPSNREKRDSHVSASTRVHISHHSTTPSFHHDAIESLPGQVLREEMLLTRQPHVPSFMYHVSCIVHHVPSVMYHAPCIMWYHLSCIPGRKNQNCSTAKTEH